MIGIYQDSFVEYLRETLGDPIQVKTKSIICRCPWCEFGEEKNHYHLWISTESPIFNCFHCNDGHGIIKNLIKSLHLLYI